ncbi:MerR family transcriptional regulator [Lentzea sp. NPDC042327]|uniref:MerR family transcriptional regulator n=1 Tax=Lentzea sp. NPDC042327 TaxID=3154801 RepID=UPI0033E9EC71
MRIGELSRATGASTRALRYYEEQGLIRSERLPNGYRDYGPEAVGVVEFVQDLLAAGLSSRVLRDVVPCVGGGHESTACSELLTMVQQVRDDLLDQERRIRARRQALEQYLTGRRSPRGSTGLTGVPGTSA